MHETGKDQRSDNQSKRDTACELRLTHRGTVSPSHHWLAGREIIVLAENIGMKKEFIRTQKSCETLPHLVEALRITLGAQTNIIKTKASKLSTKTVDLSAAITSNE